MAEELENKDELNEEETSEESGEAEEVQEDERLTKRKKKTESRRKQAIVSILLVAGILVVLNIIALKVFFRWDLTPNKIYTLSDASENIVSKLDDKLVIKAYFTDNLPAPYNNNRRYLQELLDDYRSASNDKISYEIISPSDEKALEDDAQKYGIQPVQVQTVENDRAQALKAYMGVVFLYGGKQETLPFVGSTENLEYDITGVINRLTQDTLKKVGVLAGPNMPGLDKIGKVSQYLSKFYEMVPVDASKNAPIPSNIKTLLVFTPKAPQQQQQQMMQQAPTVVPDNLKFAIDQYVMNGGRVIFLMSKVTVTSQQQFQIAQVAPTGLEDMLESYGLKSTSNILIDKECAYISVPVQQGPLQMYTQIPFPYYPKIVNVNKDIPSFSGIGQVFLGFSTDIDLGFAGPKGLKVTPLLTTSPKTGVFPEFAMVQATGKMLPDSMFKFKDLNVGAIFEGKFTSFYNGKQIPVDTVAGSAPPAGNIKPESNPDGKIVMMGNGDFALDEFRGPDENLLFFANIIDYMTDDAGLSMIRMKDANPKPLNSIEESTRSIVKYGMLVGPPLLVLIYGLLRWRKKKAARA